MSSQTAKSGSTPAGASAVEFHVQPFSQCSQEVIAFRNLNRPSARDEGYFAWRYRRPCSHEPFIVWARNASGAAVGAASVIPHDYFMVDDVYPVGLLGDISVLPTCRGQGVASRMLCFLAQHPVIRTLRACIVLPNDEVSGSLGRAGWRPVTTVDRFVKILDAGPALKRGFGNGPAVGWLAAAVNRVLAAMSQETRMRLDGMALDRAIFDERYDALWRDAAQPGRVVAVRDRAYLDWRFTRHPHISYRAFEVRQAGKLAGFVVFHEDDALTIVDDYLVARPETSGPLFAAFFRWLRKEGGKVVQVRTHHAGCFALPWLRFGLIRRRDSQRVMLLDPHASRSSIGSAQEWHVTAADKDV